MIVASAQQIPSETQRTNLNIEFLRACYTTQALPFDSAGDQNVSDRMVNRFVIMPNTFTLNLSTPPFGSHAPPLARIARYEASPNPFYHTFDAFHRRIGAMLLFQDHGLQIPQPGFPNSGSKHPRSPDDPAGHQLELVETPGTVQVVLSSNRSSLPASHPPVRSAMQVLCQSELYRFVTPRFACFAGYVAGSRRPARTPCPHGR